MSLFLRRSSQHRPNLSSLFVSSFSSFSNVSSKIRMTNSEAFVETLVSYQTKEVFGIVGSAFMDPLDLFPLAGIRFISVQHEQNAAHMADGYSRVLKDKPGICIAQNGPGITNFITGIAAAYWAHSPVVAITPEAGTMTKGYGGFQEVDQVPLFQSITKHQIHVNNPARIAELTSRALHLALLERGPTQLNIPRDYFYGENDFLIPKPNLIKRPAGNGETIEEASQLILKSKKPFLLVGGGVVISDARKEIEKLAEFLGAPVATTYLHNDAFSSQHELMTGSLGYQGSQAAMKLLKESDLVIALGTRLNPFGTIPQYGIDYWPPSAKLIQVEIDPKRLNWVKQADVAVHGDVKLVATQLLEKLSSDTAAVSSSTKRERLAEIKKEKQIWEAELNRLTSNDKLCPEQNGKIKPRAALRELEKALPQDVIVSTDIGNVCSVSNSYLRFQRPQSFLAAMTFGNCGYSFPAAIGAKVASPERPVIAYVGDGAWGMSFPELLTCVREDIPTTVVVFNNGQWGAEKKNQVLWFGDRYVATNLINPNFSDVAKALKVEGIRVDSLSAVGDALRTAIDNQMKHRKTTVIELMLTKELGDPFRRDAMKLPQRLLPKYSPTSLTNESPTGQPVDL